MAMNSIPPAHIREIYIEAKDQLVRARERLLSPGHWVKWAMAVDAIGKPISYNDAAAVAWSAYGAIKRESREAGFRSGGNIPRFTASQVAISITKGSLLESIPDTFAKTDDLAIIDYNNAGFVEHSDVILWFDKAIALTAIGIARYEEFAKYRQQKM